jgi:Tol biopolymer transport system component
MEKILETRLASIVGSFAAVAARGLERSRSSPVGALLLAAAVTLAPTAAAADDADQYGPWSAPVNLGTPVNSALAEQGPAISKDGRSLYFACCPLGPTDIYVSQRASVDAPWGPPQILGPDVNTIFLENSPALSPDGHRLYFNSNRPGGLGLNDIYVSRRHNKRDDFAWRPAENLGSGVNSPAGETGPFIIEDDATGTITLYFSSNRGGGAGLDDIYSSTLQPDETFGQASNEATLNSGANDGSVAIRRDGLELILQSNRVGSMLNAAGVPGDDLWISTRFSTSDTWSAPVNLDPFGVIGINTGRPEGAPGFSFDGTMLFFQAAQRAGNVGPTCATSPTTSGCAFDLWSSSRSKQ